MKGRRKVCFSGAAGMLDCDLYDREKLLFGDRFGGPAIIEQMDTTTLILPGMTARVDAYLNLILETKS